MLFDINTLNSQGSLTVFSLFADEDALKIVCLSDLHEYHKT